MSDKQRFDFIFDFETLSQDMFNGVAVECSMTFFEWDRFIDNPYTLQRIVDEVKTLKISVKDQVRLGRKIEESTLDFWKGLPKESREILKPLDTDLSLNDFMTEFLSYVNSGPKVSYWWSRSNTFDPIIIESIARQTDAVTLLKKLLPFWRVRDVRTYIDANFDFETKNGFVPVSDQKYWQDNFKEHNSKYDIAADILRLQAIVRLKNGRDLLPY